MRDVVIVSAARTAIGRAPKGTLRYTRPDDLAATAISAAIERATEIKPADVEDVIFGCAMPEAEQGMDIARVAALRAGLPNSVPGLTVNRFCASGLEAIAIAGAKIASGQADIIIAGGAESMTMVQFMGPTTKPNPTLMDRAPDTYLSMGLSTERVAKEFGITREMADMFSLGSHEKAIAAQDAGKFSEEITPVMVVTQTAKGDEYSLGETAFITDEGPRRGTSMEALAKLKPAFMEGGIITAGNASQLSDGAAALVMMTREKALEYGLKPLARFVGYAVAAVEPERFGVAPAYAIPKLLRTYGHTIDKIDLIEFNEAFAAQTLASNEVYPLPMERVNVNGGAIALGHPLGATGARQTVTLLHEAKRRGAKYGIVTMCAALGMGAAGLFEFE